jgi:hypothetical protein
VSEFNVCENFLGSEKGFEILANSVQNQPPIRDYAGSTGGKKAQGKCQGNGATPADWTVTSIAMIQAHKRKGHGVHLTCPITKTSLHPTGTLYVDDTDIEPFDMTKIETVQEVHGARQNSIHNWGHILIHIHHNQQHQLP